MQIKTSWLLGDAIRAWAWLVLFFLISTVRVTAQYVPLAISATVSVENPSQPGLITKETLTTESLLKFLAMDETTAGNWTNANGFPPGSELLYSLDAGSGSFPGFEVWIPKVSTMDVSSILGFSQIGNGINVGGNSDQSEIAVGVLSYDATSAGGSNKFTLTGISTVTTISTPPKKNQFYTQYITFSLQDGTGEGVNASGLPILLTGGTASARESAVYQEGAGGDGGFSLARRGGTRIMAPGKAVLRLQVGAERSTVFSISGSLMTQGRMNVAGDANETPSRTVFSTQALLKMLAADEHLAGVWTNMASSNQVKDFPAGTRLNMTSTNGIFVESSTNFSLCVSNILSLTNTGSNILTLGRGTLKTSEQLATLTYDATPTGGTNQFSISGLGVTKPVAQSPQFLLLNGDGEGVNASGTPVAFSGVTLVAVRVK